MADIEDLGFDLKTGLKVASKLPFTVSSAETGVIEVSRREDAATALECLWEALVLRRDNNLRYNNLVGTKYRLDLSDPEWKVLVLWTKEPGKVKEWLEKEHPNGDTLLDRWTVYVVWTCNGHNRDLEPGTQRDSLEEILKDFEDLVQLLVEKQHAPPADVLYPKIGDPLVRYRKDGKLLNNWSDFGAIYERLALYGFSRAHFGPLDTRGPWKRAEDMAREQGVELVPFDWESTEDIAAVFREIKKMADPHGIELASCGWHGRVVDGHKVPQGICVALAALNKLLPHGTTPIRGQTSTKPNGKGKRKCGCQNTADIGLNVLRRGKSSREKCRECVSCFVRCKGKGGEGKNKRE